MKLFHRHSFKESNLSRMTDMVLAKGEVQTDMSAGVREMLLCPCVFGYDIILLAF